MGIWAVSPRHVDLSFPNAFNKAIARGRHLSSSKGVHRAFLGAIKRKTGDNKGLGFADACSVRFKVVLKVL